MILLYVHYDGAGLLVDVLIDVFWYVVHRIG